MKMKIHGLLIGIAGELSASINSSLFLRKADLFNFGSSGSD